MATSGITTLARYKAFIDHVQHQEATALDNSVVVCWPTIMWASAPGLFHMHTLENNHDLPSFEAYTNNNTVQELGLYSRVHTPTTILPHASACNERTLRFQTTTTNETNKESMVRLQHLKS